MKYKVGDKLVNTEYEGFTYEIIDVNNEDKHYKYKITETPAATVDNGNLGFTDWAECQQVEEMTRKITKLDKALK